MKKKCFLCKKIRVVKPAGELHEVCKKCFTTLGICDFCNDFELLSMLYILLNNKYCRICRATFIYTCDYCDNTYDMRINRYIEADNNERVCSNCEPSNQEKHKCYVCSQQLTTFFFCDECEKNFCSSCNKRHTHIWTFYKGTTETQFIQYPQFVGLELEVEKGNIEKLKKNLPIKYQLTHDGSLDKSGVEILIPPSSLNLLEENIREVCKIINNSGFKATKNCGLHIHINGEELLKEPKKAVQLLSTMYAIEDIIYSLLPPSRWDSRFCYRLSDSYLYKDFQSNLKREKLESIWYKTDNLIEKEERKKKKYDDTRYLGFNLHSLFYRGTIEFRYHSGTTQDYKILYWIEFLLSIYNFAVNNYNEDTIQTLFNTLTSQNKFDYMCNQLNISSNLRKYLYDRIIKFNKNFVVKFNEGKSKRNMQTYQNTIMLTTLKTKLKSIELKIEKQRKKEKIKPLPSEKDSIYYVPDNGDLFIMPERHVISISDLPAGLELLTPASQSIPIEQSDILQKLYEEKDELWRMYQQQKELELKEKGFLQEPQVKNILNNMKLGQEFSQISSITIEDQEELQY